MKTIKVRDLAEEFDWEVIAGMDDAMDRTLELADVNRPGLELAGYFPDTPIQRLCVLGEKECKFIEEEMDEVDQRRSFEFLTSDYSPAILITHNQPCPQILEDIAKRKNFPLFSTCQPTGNAIVDLTNYLDEMLAESTYVHGEFLRIFGVGVLITGRSGMGKSEIALELIKRGHQIIADDRVDVYKMHNSLIGRTSKSIKGFMEMRGIGVINVARMFGITALAEQATVQLHIELEPFNDTEEYDRIGIEEKEYSEILGVEILKLQIPVSPGRPMGTIIETAVTNFLLMKNGVDSAKEFEEVVLKKIEENTDESEDNNALVSGS